MSGPVISASTTARSGLPIGRVDELRRQLEAERAALLARARSELDDESLSALRLALGTEALGPLTRALDDFDFDAALLLLQSLRTRLSTPNAPQGLS